jgi:hypothetical protein
MLAVFGLNKEIWEKIQPAEQSYFTLAARLYLVTVCLSIVAGMRFMYQLSDNYFIGISGGLLVGYIISVVIRIALITMISKPLLPAEAEVKNEASLAEKIASGLKKIQQSLPDFSLIFRATVILLMALVVSMPLATLLSWNASNRLVETRRAEVLNQFKSNHPDFSAERIQNAQKNLEHEHFPIYVYKNTLVSPVGLLVFLLCTSCFIVPFLLLWHLRTNNRFRYAALNRDVLVSRIQSDYALAIEQGQRIQKTRYGLDSSVQPHKAWLDPPFNIHGIGEKPLYTFETEKEFEERMKAL